jgi:hypothetical protein
MYPGTFPPFLIDMATHSRTLIYLQGDMRKQMNFFVAFYFFTSFFCKLSELVAQLEIRSLTEIQKVWSLIPTQAKASKVSLFSLSNS